MQMSNNISPENNKYSITKDTKVGTLLKEYPFLKNYLLALSPKFENLNSPMFKTMSNIATINMISARGGFEAANLINKLVEEIDRKNNE
jgi:hypothetical protein